MKRAKHSHADAPRRPAGTLWVAAALVTIAWSASLQAALPAPLVEMRFSEGSDVITANSGSLGGSASFAQSNAYPLFTNNVPTGVYAPANNAWAVDFGAILAGQGGRSVDLTAANGDGTLGAMNAFTICGWLNARDLNEGWGGNRIAFALASADGPGFDLVQVANGSLRIGINQWPDGANGGGPQSMAGAIKADPQNSPANWVFFAVTYDPSLATGNLNYYFGSPTALASLGSAHNYKGGLDNGGVIESSGFLTLGNFSDVVGARNETGPGGGSRVFRGLMDELRIYGAALTLAEVQQAQLNGALPAVPASITAQPAGQTVFAGQPATFRVQVSGSAPFTYQWQRGETDIVGATDSTYTLATTSTGDNGAVFRVKVRNSATPGGVLSEPSALTVLPESGHKISVSFSDGGLTVTNLGNLGGYGAYAVTDSYPAASANVPVGAFAPSNNVSSVDFGGIAAGQGGRAVDLTNRIDNTLGPMTAFTVSGWLNCGDLTEGWGGNRIVFALATPGGAGFDLVQVADGSLRLGVNQWPDGGTGGPLSSPGKIVADASASPANWVFFAVTYDSTLPSANVTYYFGSPSQEAQADLVSDYTQGRIQQTGPLTIGNFSTVAGARVETGPGGGSRCFRGLIDEINVFNKALTLGEIQAIQKAPAYKPAVLDPPTVPAMEPANQTVFAGGSVAFQVNASGTPPLSYQWWTSHAGAASAISGATNRTYTRANAVLGDSGNEYWVIVANQVGSVTSRKALLAVLPETNYKVGFSFSEGSGTTAANQGNVGGSGALVQVGGFPAFVNLVPAGPFAPTGNSASVDFGVIADTEGGRAIDLTPSVSPTIGAMQGFTVTGWLNCRDLRYGWGGNRILYCQAAPGSGGFDLVQEAGGVLWIGVNQWPDAQPNSPAKSLTALTEDPEAGPDNWAFFAFTYDGMASTGNASFYFGSPTQAAVLDSTTDYDRGPITSLGPLSVGNFSASDNGARTGTGNSGGSRCFRGLMDEINVFNKVLTLPEIQAVQKAPPMVPVQPAVLAASLQGNQVVISWISGGNLKLQKRADLGPGGSWIDETNQPVVNGFQKTVQVPNIGSAQFFRLIGQ